MKIIKLIFVLISLTILNSCSNNSAEKSVDLMISDRIDGPANIRDTINGKKILFSLDDNLIVECTEIKNDWQIVGLYVKLDSIQNNSFKFIPGDTLYNSDGFKIGITISETEIWMTGEDKGEFYGLIVGYTHKQNIKVESVIENVIVEIINSNKNEITIDDLKTLIETFKLETCSPTSMADENGKWYFQWDNSIDDPSPQDRITLIIEDNKLIGIVHARKINFKNQKTYDLIRGHKFTPIANLTDIEINKIIKERALWYNSID